MCVFKRVDGFKGSRSGGWILALRADGEEIVLTTGTTS